MCGGREVEVEHRRLTRRPGHPRSVDDLFTRTAYRSYGILVLCELPERAGYFRILLAIANGHRTYGAIRTFADIEIDRQLDRIVRIGLVERVVPATDDPMRTRRAVYRIADNFLAFGSGSSIDAAATSRVG